jgi:hypothetical protein
MNMKTAGCVACAAVAGLMLWGCASAPAQKGDSAVAPAAPTMTDISQVPGLESTLYVSESASVTRPPQPAPTADELARAAMQRQTTGMAPGAVTGGPKDQIVVDVSKSNAPAAGAVKREVVIPALQPEALLVPPEEERSWKKPLPPLPSLESK